MEPSQVKDIINKASDYFLLLRFSNVTEPSNVFINSDEYSEGLARAKENFLNSLPEQNKTQIIEIFEQAVEKFDNDEKQDCNTFKTEFKDQLKQANYAHDATCHNFCADFGKVILAIAVAASITVTLLALAIMVHPLVAVLAFVISVPLLSTFDTTRYASPGVNFGC